MADDDSDAAEYISPSLAAAASSSQRRIALDKTILADVSRRNARDEEESEQRGSDVTLECRTESGEVHRVTVSARTATMRCCTANHWHCGLLFTLGVMVSCSNENCRRCGEAHCCDCSSFIR